MKTIIELESLLSNVESSPRTYFGDEIDARLRLLLKDCHPDHFKSDADKESADRLFKRFSTLADECRAALPTNCRLRPNPWSGFRIGGQKRTQRNDLLFLLRKEITNDGSKQSEHICCSASDECDKNCVGEIEPDYGAGIVKRKV